MADNRLEYYVIREKRRKRRRRQRNLRAAGLALIAATLLFLTSGAAEIPKGTPVEAAVSEQEQRALSAANVPSADASAGGPALLSAGEGGLGGERELDFHMYEKDPNRRLIVVDPGHGGTDEGCMAGGVMEKDINLQIAEQLKSRLEALGYQVLLTREDDSFVDRSQRVEMANRCRGDAFVSIHQNTYEEPKPSGIEMWYDGTDSERDSARLARLIHKKTAGTTGAVMRELKDDAEFAVTGQTRMAACLIETGFLSNPEERRRLGEAEYQGKLADGIAAGIDAYFNPKIMYLTFDDGPSEENTAAVLDVLKEKKIKATFFVVGENVRRHPEVARRIAAEGHTIGIHCNRHRYEEIYQSVDSYLADFDEAYRAVYEVTGVEAKLFRFPGGSVNAYDKAVYQDIIEAMEKRGFTYFDWNASLEDAVRKAEPETLIASAKDTAMGRRKVVLLAHDIVHSTALCLGELIDEFPEYRMEPLTPEVAPVQFPR